MAMTKEERAAARAQKKAQRVAAREARKSYVPSEADMAREEIKDKKVFRGCMIGLTVALAAGMAVTAGCCIYTAAKEGAADPLNRDDADDAAESLGLCRSTDMMY